MKFLIVGLGSMGKRRIRNLQFNCEENIIGFDFLVERRKEAEKRYGIRTVGNLQDVSESDYDAVIISTSPNQHGDYIRFALKNKKHFFVEVATSDDGYKEAIENKDTGLIKAPSCTFRYYLPIKIIKNILQEKKIGKILAFQYHMGQYLPDWHSWEDYRQVYFSKKETGACREMLPFELIWLNWLMGSKVVDISGIITKISDLDIDADDIILSNLKYENGILGNVLIDAISRKPVRTLRVLGSEGVLDWEMFDHEIKLYDAKSKNTETIAILKGNPETGYINEEEMYNDEIKTFLEAIRGEAPYSYSFQEDLSNLKILYRLVSGEK